MRAIIRHGGEERWVDLDLDDEIRSGRLGGDARLWYPPWTGERFVRVADIPEAEAALDAQAARLASRFAAPVRTPAIFSLVVILLLGAVVQSAGLGGLRVPDASWLDQVALSWESTLLGGAWWTVWTAPLLHASGPHLLVNLAVLTYAGWRVERAVGSTFLIAVVVAAWVASTFGVLAFAGLPVIGASALTYGVWAAQIAVGLRLGDHLPPAERPYYGWGNLVFFAPLWLSGVTTEGVSMAAHLGGLMGGGVAALLLPSPILGPRAEARTRARRVSTGAILAASGLGLVLLLTARRPDLMGLPWREVDVGSAGVTIWLPERYAVRERTLGGLTAWVPADDPHSGAFCGLARGDPDRDPDARMRAWGQLFGGSAHTRGPAEVLDNGWSRTRVEVRASDRVIEVVELDVRRGQTLLRCGWWAPGGGGGAAEPFYNAVFARMQIADPPALAHARERWVAAPDSPSRVWDYAVELSLVGEAAQADALLAGLDDRDDRWAVEAARARVDLWQQAPSLASAVPSTTLSRWIEAAGSYDLSLIERSVDTLVARQECEIARRAASALHRRLSRDAWETVEERLGVCRAITSGGVRL